MHTNNEEVKALVGEIFELTGQKVEVNDPIVAAALIQSQLIRRAGQDAITAIQLSVDKAAADLAEAVKAERQTATELSQMTARAYGQIMETARAISDGEMQQLKAQFLAAAQDVMQRMRKQATTIAPAAWKMKVAFSLSFMILLGMLAGGIIGATWYSNNRMTAEEVKQLAAGKDFLAILPKLDKQTRDKLARIIENNQQQ